MRNPTIKVLAIIFVISNISYIPNTLSNQQQYSVESRLQQSIDNLEVYKQTHIFNPNYVRSTYAKINLFWQAIIISLVLN